MALNDAALNIGANAMRSALAWVSLHWEIPDPSGSNETSAPRQHSAWAVPTNGDLVSASISFSGGTPNGPVLAVGFWSEDVGGAFYGYYPVTEDKIFNAGGNYVVGAFTLTGGST